VNALLFAATVVSILFVQSFDVDTRSFAHLADGAVFAGSLLAILVAHEMGHYVAARVHKVDTSLPYFIPMPFSPFGTMGAVIRMRGTIPTRRALLDIGAAGPLAGLALAIPLYAWGAAHSTFIPRADTDGMMNLGESLLTKVLDHLAGASPPPGMETSLSPMAFAAWAGMFVTMINLIPVGQLDGGHVAYALFGAKQDKIAVVVHRAMLAFFVVSVVSYVARDVRGGVGLHHVGRAISSSMFWFLWFEALAILGSLGRRRERGEPEGLPVRTRVLALVGLVVLPGAAEDAGRMAPLLLVAWLVGFALLLAMEARSGVLRRHHLVDHPPTSSAPLDPVRAVIAVVTLAFFALLFMPTPIAM
jgi:membrane-associated protease RseP (regulator of RpoE activity)